MLEALAPAADEAEVRERLRATGEAVEFRSHSGSMPIREFEDQLPLLMTDHLKIRQIHQVQEIGGGDVVDFRLLAAQMQRFGELQHRLPQMRIIGDDDPRRRGAEMMHQS